MSAEEVKDWCKSNWSKIEVENITIVNLNSLINHLGGSKSFKKKAEGVVKLLQPINKKKVPEESEKPEEKLEEGARGGTGGESQVSRRKGQKHNAFKKEEDEKEEGEDKVLKEEEEVGVKGKECVDVHPVKKVCITKRQPVALPEATLSVVEKASYFLNLTFAELGMFLLYSYIFLYTLTI